MALNAKKKKAIDAYLKGMDKKSAMIEAGYAETTASTKHSDVFGDPEVEKEIERRQKIASTRVDVSLEWALGKLKEVAEANLGDIIEIEADGSYKVNMTKMGPNLKAALTNFTVDEMSEGRGEDGQKFKRLRVGVSDKVRAIDLIIRHAGLSKEKLVLEVEDGLVEKLQRGRQRVAGNE